MAYKDAGMDLDWLEGGREMELGADGSGWRILREWRETADLAANAATPPAGWSTVGLGGKVIPGAAPKPAGISIPAKPISATPITTRSSRL